MRVASKDQVNTVVLQQSFEALQRRVPPAISKQFGFSVALAIERLRAVQGSMCDTHQPRSFRAIDSCKDRIEPIILRLGERENFGIDPSIRINRKISYRSHRPQEIPIVITSTCGRHVILTIGESVDIFMIIFQASSFMIAVCVNDRKKSALNKNRLGYDTSPYCTYVAHSSVEKIITNLSAIIVHVVGSVSEMNMILMKTVRRVNGHLRRR